MKKGRSDGLVWVVALMILAGVSTKAPAAQVTLAWDPPLMNEDGSTPPDVAGYRVHYGTSATSYSVTNDVGPTNSITLTGLDPIDTYFFAVTAYSSADVESQFSSELRWTADGDTDGLPDLWERENFGGTQVLGGSPEDDFDGDGYVNILEFIAGTCATIESGMDMLTVERASLGFILRLQTIATAGGAYDGLTRVYTIEMAPSLQDCQWMPVPGCERIVAGGQLFSYTMPCELGLGYFRTRVALE